MVRDNYTCQICGKYMPDEVGLQVDHIIPVAKGGKTVESEDISRCWSIVTAQPKVHNKSCP